MHREPAQLVLVLRSLLFYVCAVLAVVPFLLLWPAILLSRGTVYAITDRYLHVLMWLLRLLCGVRFEINGADNVPEGPVLYASQHESTWETLFYQVLLNRPATYAKKPIFSYPIFGPVMRKLGHIPVETSASGDAMRAGFRAGVAAVQQGRSLVIFPSGTRRKSQAAELQAGVGVLYQLAGVPTVPIQLNSGDVWPHGTWIKRPGVVQVRIGVPIPVGLDRRSFMKNLANSLAIESAGPAVENT